MKKFLLGCMFLGTSLYSLEFGYMGNKAFGMGGSGVALSSNPFAAYYNPALLSMDRGIGIGYSLGFRYKEHNVGDIADLNINTARNFLNDNSLNLTSENGIALRIPFLSTAGTSSSIGIGLFYTKIGTINFLSNSNNRLDARLLTNGLDLLEVPLSYSLNLSSAFGNFSVGINAKYIYANHSLASRMFSGGDTLQEAFSKAFRSKNGVATNTFGVDVGLAYSLPFDALVIGIVGKNLNSPDIKTMSREKLELDSQYRLGVSTSIIPLTTLALDLDLKPNTEFRGLDNGMAKKKSQYVSLGGALNLTFMDIRLGVAKNLANSADGLLIYGGLGFKVIDISLFSSTNTTKGNQKIPTEFGIKLGGGFSF